MNKLGLMLALSFACTTWAGTVDMIYENNTGFPGFYVFKVNGISTFLICDEFSPNVATGHYDATIATLANLTGSTLVMKGDSNALRKYQEVAILDLIAFSDPSNSALATSVTWANRRIIDGSGPLPGMAQTLYDFVLTANPANYDLTGFRIYTSSPFTLSQEQTGYEPPNVPESGTVVLIGAGLVMFGFGRYKMKQRQRLVPVQVVSN